jgi:uncharacterized membrane protein
MRAWKGIEAMRSPRVNTLALLAAAALLCLATASSAGAATLQWDPGGGVADGYKIHYGTSASTPSQTIDVGSVTQYSIDHLPLQENVEYFFSVSAYNAAGESPPCQSIAYTPEDSTPPPPPVELVVE